MRTVRTGKGLRTFCFFDIMSDSCISKQSDSCESPAHSYSTGTVPVRTFSRRNFFQGVLSEFRRTVADSFLLQTVLVSLQPPFALQSHNTNARRT